MKSFFIWFLIGFVGTFLVCGAVYHNQIRELQKEELRLSIELLNYQIAEKAGVK